MKVFIKSLFSEAGAVSMTRVLSALCVSVACMIILYGMIRGLDLNSLSGICSTFLGFGLAAKVAQKSMESKG